MPDLRKDLISSAVTFLHDPQVASASLAKKIEFLESKELTPEEIQEALSQASTISESHSTTSPSNPISLTPPPIPAYSYGAYNQPPPVPKRDWRDYFVMATLSVGLTYGLYEVAKRYLLPSIVPPTPAALEADTNSLELEFSKAQAILDQLQDESVELKKVQMERTKKVEEMILEVESTMTMIRNKTFQHDEDMKLIQAQIETVQDTLPKSLTEHGEVQSHALDELMKELKSLKLTVSTQLQGPHKPVISNSPPQNLGNTTNSSSSNTIPSLTSGYQIPSSSSSISAESLQASNSAPPRTGIPAWQLAAGGSK